MTRKSAPAKPRSRAPGSKSRAHAPVAPEEILAPYGDAIRELAQKARQLVRAEAPDATEAGYRGWRLIGYRAPHYFCFVAPHNDHVRVGFEHGNRLSDPRGVLESMGKQVRFVRLVPGKRIPAAAIRELIQAALVLRGQG